MNRRAVSFLIFLFITASWLSILLTPEQSEAMPGWGRKYRFSCSTCHAPFPRLKAYGDEFAGNGFRLPEGEPHRAYHDTGDPLLELARDIPLGFRIDVLGTYEPDSESRDSTKEDMVDLKMPYNVKIISGGPIADKIAYYFYFFFSERGEIAGLEDALLFFRDVYGSGVNLTVGQFAVSDPLFKGELRLTNEAYIVFQKKPPRSYANLKYDRGIVLDYGFDFGLELVFQVLNGNGISEAHGVARSFDQDSYKNYMARVSQEIGPVRIGGFGYWGKETNSSSDGSSFYYDNTMSYVGVDGTISFEYGELNVLFLTREDSNPYFERDGQTIESSGLMIEALLFPFGQDGRWAITGLYNAFDSEYADNILDYESLTINASYLLARNVKIMTEYTRIFKDYSSGLTYEDKNRFLVGLVTGF